MYRSATNLHSACEVAIVDHVFLEKTSANGSPPVPCSFWGTESHAEPQSEKRAVRPYVVLPFSFVQSWGHPYLRFGESTGWRFSYQSPLTPWPNWVAQTSDESLQSHNQPHSGSMGIHELPEQTDVSNAMPYFQWQHLHIQGGNPWWCDDVQTYTRSLPLWLC